MNVSAEYESLPPNASSERRRSSVIALDRAVADLAANDGLAQLTDIIEPIFVKRKPSRRQSVPVQSRRRYSLTLLRSKSFGGDALGKKKEL